MLRKLLESMNCFAASIWRFLCAKQWKCSSVDGRKTTNERQTRNELIGPNFRDWSEFSTDWSERRTIGPNSERLVRILNNWSKFRTIGPNFRKIGLNFEQMTSLTLRPRWTCWRSEICQSVKCQKKLAWTDLDRVSLKKFVKQSSVKIKKSVWTGLDKVKKGPLQRQVSLQKVSSRLVTQKDLIWQEVQ